MPDNTVATVGKLQVLHCGEKRLGFDLDSLRKQPPSTRSQDIGQWIVDFLGLTKPDNVDSVVYGVSLSLRGSGRLDTRLDTPPISFRHHPGSRIAPSILSVPLVPPLGTTRKPLCLCSTTGTASPTWKTERCLNCGRCGQGLPRCRRPARAWRSTEANAVVGRISFLDGLHCVVGWNWCYRCYYRGYGDVQVVPEVEPGGTDDAAGSTGFPPSFTSTPLNHL